MSVHLTRASNQAAYHNTLQADTTIATYGGWFQLASIPGAGAQYQVAVLQNGVGDGCGIRIDENGHIGVFDEQSGNGTFGSTVISTGVWHHLWVRIPATGLGAVTCVVYLDGSTTPEVSRASMTWRTGNATTWRFSHPSYTPLCFDGDLVGWKVWAADVAASEANTEKATGTATHTADLIEDWHLPSASDLTGHTNGLDLTAVNGPLTDGANDPAGYSESGEGPTPAFQEEWFLPFAAR